MNEINLYAYGRVKIDPASYKAYLEELGGYMKIPPLVGGDFGAGGSNAFEGIISSLSTKAIYSPSANDIPLFLAADTPAFV